MTKSNSLRLFVAMFVLSALCLTVVGAAFADAAFLPVNNLAVKKVVTATQVRVQKPVTPLAYASPSPTPKAGGYGPRPGDIYTPPIIPTAPTIDSPILPDIDHGPFDGDCFPIGPIDHLVIRLPESMPSTIPAGRTYFSMGVYAYNADNCSLGLKDAAWNFSGSGSVEITEYNQSSAPLATIKGLRAGNVTLEATLAVNVNGTIRIVSASTPLTVRPSDAYIIDLTAEPASGAVLVGEELTLTATVYDQFNNTINGLRVYFDSTNFVFTETGSNETSALTANGSIVLHMNSTAPGYAVVTAYLDRPTGGTSCHFVGDLPSGRISCIPVDELRSPRIHLPANFTDDYNPVYSDNVTVWIINGQPTSLVLTANPASLEADGVSNSTITATILDSYGNPTFARVNFSTTDGTLSDDSVLAGFFDNGTTQVNLTASLDVVDAVVTAIAYWPSTNFTPVTAQIIVPFTAGPAASLDLNLSTHDTFQGDPVDVHIAVEDARGHVVTDGTIVAFCATPEGGAEACTNYTTTNGTVDFVFTWPDPVRVTVNATSGAATDGDSVVFRVLPPAYLLIDAVSPVTIGQQSLVTATLLNRNYLPVPDGAIIEFTVLAGNGLLSAPAATTVGGIAQVNLTSDESGYVTVGASWNSTLFNTTQVLFVGEPAHIVLTADNYAPVAGQQIVLTANVTDENGYPAAAGTVVDFVAPASVVFTNASMPTTDGIALTNASSTVAGTYVITAIVGGLQANVTITVSPAAPAQITITPTGVTLRAGGSQQFNAVVSDAYGNVVSVPVSWSTGALGSINASGYFTAIRAGNETVSAAVGPVFNSTNVTIRPGQLALLEVTALPTSIQVGGATSALTITGRDLNGDLVDEALNVSLDSSLGTLSTNQVTLASGTATATLTSGTVVGNATVAAVNGPVLGLATVEFVHGPAAVITAIALPALVSPNGVSIISARVTDAFGNPIQGQLVLFAITASPAAASLSAANASTDSLGQAITALTTGSAEGFYNVSATVNGTSLTANVSVEVQRGIGTIAGYVKNFYGVGVANATVNVNGTNVTTLSDGYYAVSMRTGVYNASASAQFHVSQAITGITVSEGVTTQINFTLLEYGTLSGVVRDSYGNFLDGATVTAGAEVATTVLGAYSMRLAPGTYDATASLAGYSSQNVLGIVVETGNSSSANFTLVSILGIVRGTVRDQLGAPIVGATVTLVGTGRTDATDATGAYEFTGVTPGDYSLTASAAGYSTGGTTATVLPGEVTVADITLYQESLLRGYVTDAAGTPIAGAFVSADATHNDTTDVSGYYEMTGLTSGSYTVSASATGYLTASGSTLIAPGVNELNFSLVQAGSINGAVNFLFGGAPVAGALVRATQDGRLIAFVDTLADGTYALNGLEQGYYNVTVSGAGFSAQTQLAYVTAGRITTLTFRVY